MTPGVDRFGNVVPTRERFATAGGFGPIANDPCPGALPERISIPIAAAPPFPTQPVYVWVGETKFDLARWLKSGPCEVPDCFVCGGLGAKP